MKEIKKSFGELTPAMIFNMIEGAPEKLKDKQEDFGCVAWIVFNDSDDPEKEKLILSLITDDGESYATNSKTFIMGFLMYWELCEKSNVPAESIRVKVDVGVSKSGREFIQCKAV